MNVKHYLGKHISSCEHYDEVGPITGVILNIDDNSYYEAGSEDGYVMEIDCPYGTQDMANNILSSLRGNLYKGYKASDAPLDINAELGDGITVDGVYSMLAYQTLEFGPLHASEISAPGESTIDHEYPYTSSTQREINRKIATVKSSITKTSEEITLKIEETDGRVTTLSQTLDGLTSTVTGLDGSVSSLQQTATSLQSQLTDAQGNINTITQTIDGVAYKSSLADGTTTINGGCITTGKVLADYIKLGGYMDLYETMDSDEVQGRYGYHNLNISSNTFDGSYTAIGVTSLTNGHFSAAENMFIIAGSWMGIICNRSIEYTCPKGGDFRGNHLFYGDSMSFNGVAFNYVSSDKRMKTDIDYDKSGEMIAMFDNLKPVSFHMAHFRQEDLHLGFVAQDVVEAAENAGISGALTCQDCDGIYTLDYGGMTAVLTAKVQQMDKRLKALEGIT